jgi:hypothetical protein
MSTTTDTTTTTPTTTTVVANDAPPARPAARSIKGLPWFIMGATFLLIALSHLDRIPEWLSFETPNGVIGSITGVLVILGIAGTLIAVGINKNRS